MSSVVRRFFMTLCGGLRGATRIGPAVVSVVYVLLSSCNDDRPPPADGRWVERRYHASGSVWKEVSVIKGGEGSPLLDGWYREWSAQGVLISETMFLQGRSVAPTRRWYEDGQLQMELVPSINGAVLATFWYENGVVIGTGTLVQEARDGLWLWWHGNGEMMREEHYVHGQLDGMARSWWPNGCLRTVEDWASGVPLHSWKCFSETGDVIECEYAELAH